MQEVAQVNIGKSTYTLARIDSIKTPDIKEPYKNHERILVKTDEKQRFGYPYAVLLNSEIGSLLSKNAQEWKYAVTYNNGTQQEILALLRNPLTQANLESLVAEKTKPQPS